MKNLVLKIKKAWWFLKITVVKKFKPETKYAFWYSKEQDSLPPFVDFYTGKPVRHCTFRGLKYSECKSFEYGYFSNWEDAKLIGIGGDKDFVWPEREPEHEKGTFKNYDYPNPL